jgi:putative aldouronate transport system permease protein
MTHSPAVNGQFLKKKDPIAVRIRGDLRKNGSLYLMLLPVVVFFLIFHYQPMYGAQIAFKDFSPGLGILDSPWVGFEHFIAFFKSRYFLRVVGNTLMINFKDLVFGFPAPILLALMINEVNSKFYRKTVQTISYMPHFVSQVVMCGLIFEFCSLDGLFNNIRNIFGLESIAFLQKAELFQGIYVGSSVWQGIGWGSIIYLSALTAIDQEQYESAHMDGAGRLRQIWSITLPNLLPTIMIMLILRIGQMMNIGVEKVMLLYNPMTYDTADVISTFVYRKGILEASYSFSAAVGLFNSGINFILLLTVNKISKRLTQTSLW